LLDQVDPLTIIEPLSLALTGESRHQPVQRFPLIHW
jgi:hypothetical protein